MPRPKRPKLVQTVPSTLRVDKPRAVSAVQRQRDLFPQSPASSGRVTGTSDDSDGLVITKRVGGKGRTANSHEYTMSGALPVEDVGETRLRPPSGPTRAALSKIARDADHQKATAMRKAKESRPQNADVTEERIPSSIPAESEQLTRHLGSRTGPFASITSALISKVQQTPLAQSSSLGGVTFKKRQRQPSLLQLARAQPNVTLDFDDDEEDPFGFCPDDESTPMIKSISHSNINPRPTSSSSHPTSRKRKLSTPEVQVRASQSDDPPSSPSAVPPHSPQRNIPTSPSSERETRSPSLPRLPPQQNPPSTPSDTLAPPLSTSSPIKSPQKQIQTNRRTNSSKPTTSKTRRRNTSLGASPSSTSSLPPTKPRNRATHLKVLTTAHLQNLLPKRRPRTRLAQKTSYDPPSSNGDSSEEEEELDSRALGEDEDELGSFNPKTKPKIGRRKKAAATTTGKENLPPPKTRPKVSKTYARRTSPLSDQESESGDEREGVGFGVLSHRHGNEREKGRVRGREREKDGEEGRVQVDVAAKVKAEMERLARKFREVDEFEMEFEDVTASSGVGGRGAR